MSLATPPKVGKLQRALHVKAKAEPEFRFYQLYDKVYREDVLAHAYRLCRANAGAPGVDGITFETIESQGWQTWLGELAQDLRKKIYRADPVRRVWIPKANGKERPLGIPTVRDRVVQMATVLVLEPIFEADLQPEQYAYRPGRSAHDAVRHVHRLVRNGYNEVVDADLSGYFDSIPHADLMRSVARRVSDRTLLSLIKQWLVVPIEEDRGSRGSKRRTNRNKRERRGVPQGAPISPLLANLYMRRFLLGWKVLGHQQRLQAYIVNYADDFVICCRANGASAMQIMRQMMCRLDLTVNEDKTCLRHLPEESIDFLGYTIGRCYSPRTGRAYIGTRPSKQSLRRVTVQISTLTAARMTLLPAEEIVRRLNRLLQGWGNYFCLGPVSNAYRAVDAHTHRRLRQWLCGKHKQAGQGTARYPDEYLEQVLGLTRLSVRTRNLPWAKA